MYTQDIHFVHQTYHLFF